MRTFMLIPIWLALVSGSARAQSCSDPVNYCSALPNSAGGGATISWTGTPSPVADDFYLTMNSGPASQPLLYYYGAGQQATPFGNGMRCVSAAGVGLFRFPVKTINAAGQVNLKVNFAAGPASGTGPGAWTPGSTWHCQAWYRDPSAGGAAFNLTDALTVQVCAGVGSAYDGMQPIPAGTYQMGRNVGGGPLDEYPPHAVSLDAFYMDTFEVSNIRFAGLMNKAYAQGRITATAGVVHQVGGAGRVLCDVIMAGYPGNTRLRFNGSLFNVKADHEDHPVVHVTWFGAAFYANERSRDWGLTPCYDEATWDCNFNADGFRLATEAEWEYAARGGEHNPYYLFPWGNTIDDSKANYIMSDDPYEGHGLPQTTPEGYYDGGQIPAGVDMANGYGLYDIVGNAMEWCNDWYSASYYGSSPTNNPTGPSSGTDRVLRGLGSANFPAYLQTANRTLWDPNGHTDSLGFRVVAPLP